MIGIDWMGCMTRLSIWTKADQISQTVTQSEESKQVKYFGNHLFKKMVIHLKCTYTVCAV